ncbi:MAG TPA: OmpA family protein [Flexivirga sp.]|uniref:OmpA family protein n=1 Tax=Flexivirga sp. TaxID=1962927 RepID=UPI002B6DEC38|nr:OmpA family protein [Flexivirga sp.]HWC22900.1 OmpA family protein [Flexivirga sp.]
MKRITSLTTATAVLAAAALLSACQQQEAGPAVSTGSATSGSSSDASQSSDSPSTSASTSTSEQPSSGGTGPEAGALSNSGGWYAEGSRVTFVYNNGIRYTVDTGAPVTDLHHTKSRTAKGSLTLTATQATWVAASGTPSTVNSKGAGVIADRSGVIGVLPDGSVTCANKKGLQFVGSDGAKGAASTSGLFYVDKSGKRTIAGKPPQGAKLAGRYVVCNVGDTSTVDLNADVLFAFGSAKLTASGKQVVDQTAATIKAHVTGKTVAVVGNTDSKGSTAFNLKLGKQRADAVAAELRAKLPGVDLKVTSNGESKPIAANTTADGADNPAGRAKNRRVSISWGNK